MAQNIKPAAQKPEDPTAPKKSGKKLVIIAVASLLLIVAAGAGWYFMKGKDHAPQVEEVKVAPPKTPIFVPLEPFTVNLQRESSDQYLQMGVTLKVFEAEYEAKIKTNLPEIRSKILQLLTTKTATELAAAEGKKQLVKEILSISNSIIGVVDAPVLAAIADKPAAASQVSAAVTEAQQPDGAEIEAASAPKPAIKPAIKTPVEKKGVVDVLFTSFIIQ